MLRCCRAFLQPALFRKARQARGVERVEPPDAAGREVTVELELIGRGAAVAIDGGFVE